jgi:hypothetical protein
MSDVRIARRLRCTGHDLQRVERQISARRPPHGLWLAAATRLRPKWTRIDSGLNLPGIAGSQDRPGSNSAVSAESGMMEVGREPQFRERPSPPSFLRLRTFRIDRRSECLGSFKTVSRIADWSVDCKIKRSGL